MPALSQEKLYTIDDIYNLKDGERAELVDGHIYYNSRNHKKPQALYSSILMPCIMPAAYLPV